MEEQKIVKMGDDYKKSEFLRYQMLNLSANMCSDEFFLKHALDSDVHYMSTSTKGCSLL